MLAVGMGNLAWMFLLDLLGALQKGTSWGQALVVPTGVALLVAAMVMAAPEFGV